MDTKTALIYTYAHLPEKIMFLANPPEDITQDKYNDLKYLNRCLEMVEELEEKDFETRKDGTFPYSKKVIIGHIRNRIVENAVSIAVGKCRDCKKPYKEHGECTSYDSKALKNHCKKFVNSTKSEVKKDE